MSFFPSQIYKGKLENGTYVAVRELTVHRRCTSWNFKLRMDLLSKFRHPHLVSLLGHCIDGGAPDDSTVPRIFLIYEYISNGNFRAHLSGQLCKTFSMSISSVLMLG